MKLILLFFDGVGLAPAGSDNPFSEKLPFLGSLLGAPLTAEAVQVRPGLVFSGLDACLDVPGIPQSATGQTTLLTGVNAAQVLGYHHPAFPNEALREIIKEHSILKQAEERGFRSTFANAYTPHYFELIKNTRRRHSVTTLCVYAAAQEFRGVEEFKAGRAVFWDFTGKNMQHQDLYGIEPLSPATAGTSIAGLSKEHDLVLYENFMPDLIGHKGMHPQAAAFLADMDSFMQGIMEHKEEETTVLIASDHGNMEDLSVMGHTRNPSLFVACGPAAGHFAHLKSLADVTPAILEVLALL